MDQYHRGDGQGARIGDTATLALLITASRLYAGGLKVEDLLRGRKHPAIQEEYPQIMIFTD